MTTVVFDLDGTTIFKGQKMSLEIEVAITALSHVSEVVFASARPIRDMLPVLPKAFHEFTLIGGNGAFIQYDGKISTISFTDRERALIIDLIHHYQLDYMVDSDWDYAYCGDLNHPLYLNVDPFKLAANLPLRELPSIVKAVFFTMEEEIVNTLLSADLCVHRHGSESLIDISPQGVSKWEGYQQIKSSNSLMMFGNDTNDLPMFENASVNYVVGDLLQDVPNAKYIEAKDVARTITCLASELM